MPKLSGINHQNPHKQGTTSGEPNTATVRVEDNTPMLPAGFQANGVGRGAVCMICHNTRNGAHNDSVVGELNDRAPHTAAQTDVIMGQNAYFVSLTGTRSPHSLLTDTCATCHMEETPPPADLSYNLGGTNHVFSASITICKDCHGDFDGGTVQAATEALLHDLEKAIETAIANEITAQTTAGNTVTVTGDVDGTETTRVITDGSTVSKVVLTETHGRMAMDLTFTDAQTITHIRLASDTVVSGGVDLTLLSSAAGQLIAKTSWNYFLIEGDGSMGVHNNKFTQTILGAALAALQ